MNIPPRKGKGRERERERTS